MGTDDRYLTDVHYIGGCVTVSELSPVRGQPGRDERDAARSGVPGPGWRDEWLARLEATPPWLIEWLRQQHDGPYWRPGSLAPDYDAIEAAILNVGGWMDSYVDAALRMQAALHAPRRRTHRRQLGPRLASIGATRARTSTSSTSSSASSTAG